MGDAGQSGRSRDTPPTRTETAQVRKHETRRERRERQAERQRMGDAPVPQWMRVGDAGGERQDVDVGQHGQGRKEGEQPRSGRLGTYGPTEQPADQSMGEDRRHGLRLGRGRAVCPFALFQRLANGSRCLPEPLLHGFPDRTSAVVECVT